MSDPTEENAWVQLGLTGAALAFRRLSERDDEYPDEGAYGALLRVDGGDIQLQRRCSICSVESFCRELEAIHRDLKGAAELGTLDDLSIRLQGDEQGHVGVEIDSGDISSVIYRLKLSFGIDQSYLPAFIRSLRATFPSRVTS
jgi:hypothetical protein